MRALNILAILVLSTQVAGAQNVLTPRQSVQAMANQQGVTIHAGASVVSNMPVVKDGINLQVVLRAQSGEMPQGFEAIVRDQLKKVVDQYDQPQGGKTVVRLNGVWQQVGGQWRLSMRVVADHLILEKNVWTRLGDSQTVSVIEVPKDFSSTLAQALDVAVQIAIEGSIK